MITKTSDVNSWGNTWFNSHFWILLLLCSGGAAAGGDAGEAEEAKVRNVWSMKYGLTMIFAMYFHSIFLLLFLNLQEEEPEEEEAPPAMDVFGGGDAGGDY